MPELPEVETVRRQLSEEIVGERVVGVEVRREKCFVGTEGMVRGGIITEVRRVGKYLFIPFESGKGLAVHLKMTGRLVIDKSWYETAPHTRVVIELESGRKLYFWDARTFGYVKAEEDIMAAEEKVKVKMGPEPWEMSEKVWLGKLKKTTRTIKDTILDQKIIAGVGNIYANDALHVAGIKPQKRANTLTRKEAISLLVAIRKVMERGLATNGASDNSYLDARGEKGEYQNEFVVYGKTGGRCPSCGKELKYGKVGGRGTWWCGRCQK